MFRKLESRDHSEKISMTSMASIEAMSVPIGLFLFFSLFPKVRSYCKSTSLNNGDLFSELHLDPTAVQLSAEQEAIGEAARRAAWAAGKVILAGSGSIDLAHGIESKIGSRDIVTKVDKEAQALIYDTILAHFPHHKFLGEEDVAPGREASQQALERLKDEPHLWIVDPVDGTTNFAHGMPLAGVIIAYASYGIIQHGFIYDPFRHESFTAWKGKGAYMNGRRISCCSTSQLDSAIVCTGSPPSLEANAACLRASNVLSHQVRTMRIIGSAAIMLSWTAIGRVTAFFETDLNAWDLAAGALLVEEAGGMVTDVWGKRAELATRNTVASNGKIHAALLEQLQIAKMWIEEV